QEASLARAIGVERRIDVVSHEARTRHLTRRIALEDTELGQSLDGCLRSGWSNRNQATATADCEQRQRQQGRRDERGRTAHVIPSAPTRNVLGPESLRLRAVCSEIGQRAVS